MRRLIGSYYDLSSIHRGIVNQISSACAAPYTDRLVSSGPDRQQK